MAFAESPHHRSALQILQDRFLNFESSCKPVWGPAAPPATQRLGTVACDWHLVGCQDGGTRMRRIKVRRICQGSTSGRLSLGFHAVNPDNQSIQSHVLEFSWVDYPNRPQVLLACWRPLIWPIAATLPRSCLVTGSFISGLCGVQTLSDREYLVNKKLGDACLDPTQHRPNYKGRSGQGTSRRSPHRNVNGKPQRAHGH